MTFPLDRSDDTLLRVVLDVMPSAVFIVDEDVRIIDANRAACGLMNTAPSSAEKPPRAGAALHCLHAAEHPEGCGRASHCADCVVRSAVGDALEGRQSLRRRTRMRLKQDDADRDVYLHVTASAFHYRARNLVLLVLEDVSEYAELRKIVPICVQCKKIREDEDYWQSVENYVGRYLDLSFSHSYCPTCKAEALRSIDAINVIPKVDQASSSTL